MPTVTCPSCQAALNVRAEHAGRSLKCPHCQAVFTVPGPAMPLLLESAGEETPPSATKPCPACGRLIAAAARKCRFCNTWLDGEREDRPAPGSSPYPPCPRCGARGAKRVIWTLWGSFYGPALLRHVRCPRCGCAYNGRTGRSNLPGILVFVAVVYGLLLTIVGGAFYMIYRTVTSL